MLRLSYFPRSVFLYKDARGHQAPSALGAADSSCTQTELQHTSGSPLSMRLSLGGCLPPVHPMASEGVEGVTERDS